MKKIGFIDHYIDNWHSNHFPQMIRDSVFKNDFEIALAWEETTPPGKKPLVEWCREYKVTPATSLEQVVDACDCVLVLSPDDADRHLPLARYALRSGKPVCIDKPYADKTHDAREMFDLAAKLRTPLMSSSSLRFTPALAAAKKDKIQDKKVHYVSSWGGGRFPVYIVHVLEMLVATIGTRARRVMSLGEVPEAPVFIVDYPDNRRGLLELYPGLGFGLAACYGDGESLNLADVQGFYEAYIQAVLNFFMTRESPVPPKETMEIVALQEAATKALERRDQWVDVEGA
jgi:hypothetical protein